MILSYKKNNPKLPLDYHYWIQDLDGVNNKFRIIQILLLSQWQSQLHPC